jgi:SRSO17 transposase
MKRKTLERLDRELEAYLSSLTDVLGRADRRASAMWYVTGLLLDGERKSLAPMAARLVDDPGTADAMRQRLQECVVISPWSDDELRERLARKVVKELPALAALIIDDTGFPKKGIHSVGVQRQYSGTLGRRDNCQVATSLHVAGERGSACIAMRLYLPESWTQDRARCRKAGVPDEVVFQTKWQLALAALDDAARWDVPKYPVLADAGYGDVGEFRAGLHERGYPYVLGVQGTHVVWAPGTGPMPPPPRTAANRGRPATRWLAGDEKPISLRKLALKRGRVACRVVRWRQGSSGRQHSVFGAVRVRTAHRHELGRAPSVEQWLLYEWPASEAEPTKYWLSTLPATTPLSKLVRHAKLRWRVERDYQEMKAELGLDHFEGRTWRGFHHHATLVAVAHAFLALRRALFPPERRAVDAAHGA